MLASALAVILGLWALIYLVDSVLKASQWTQQWYADNVMQTGLTVHVGQIRWFTLRFNAALNRIGQMDWLPWKLWFTFGILVVLISMVLSVALLTLFAFNTLMQKPIEQQVLIPVIPGVNLPMSHLGFILLTLIICGILHELGHALAAVRERVRVNGFGFFICLIYPGAYVDMATSDLQGLSPLRQLRVFCAGVWHNIIIVLIGLALFHAQPWLMSPGYSVGRGVAVIYLREKSVVTGRRGLTVGDAITQVNNCPVHTQLDWFRCVEEAQVQPPPGYCFPLASLRQLDTSAGHVRRMGMGYTECCANQSAGTHLCFIYTIGKAAGVKGRYACLPARLVTERGAVCRRATDCYQSATGSVPPISVPTTTTVCLQPSMDNGTRLLRIVHSASRPPILFLGDTDDLLDSVGVSDYVPRLVPSLLIGPAIVLPYVVATFCKYLISLSAALALINVIPCYGLDGQWILHALLELCPPSSRWRRQNRQLLFSFVLFAGTVLLVVNLVLALRSSIPL